jgi:drug/metabolite transporter (DMT)-like permease
VTTVVFVAVILAAMLHAGWNAFLKLDIEPLLVMTLMALCSAVVGAALLLVVGLPARASWPWLGLSGVIHLAYFVALTESYRIGDMSTVYPIARGGAPMLTTVATFVLLDEAVSARAVTGILLIGVGIGLVALVRAGPKARAVAAPVVGLALVTATCICAYTVVDGVGARASKNPHAYAAATFVFDTALFIPFVIWRRGTRGLGVLRKYVPHGLAGGAMSLAAYWIALWAMTLAPIALVAGLREASVLFASIIAIVFLKEPFVLGRVLAAMLIVGGAILIRLG